MTEDPDAVSGATGSRRAVSYLVAPEADDYVAIMAVLEASLSDLTPAEVRVAIARAGVCLDLAVVEDRLDQLRGWGAASARTDTSRILRHADLLARNWRWTATPAGKQVQRFATTVLADLPAMREIPLTSLRRIVESLEALIVVDLDGPGVSARVAELTGRLFTAHDDLDSALVGAEDTLATLADRFDLDDAGAAGLQGCPVARRSPVLHPHPAAPALACSPRAQRPRRGQSPARGPVQRAGTLAVLRPRWPRRRRLPTHALPLLHRPPRVTSDSERPTGAQGCSARRVA